MADLGSTAVTLRICTAVIQARQRGIVSIRYDFNSIQAAEYECGISLPRYSEVRVQRRGRVAVLVTVFGPEFRFEITESHRIAQPIDGPDTVFPFFPGAILHNVEGPRLER